MKMKLLKRVLLITFLMALLFCATTMSTSAASEWYTVDGIVGGQILFDTETGEITDAETTIVVADIPSTIDGVTVKQIGRSAFRSCKSLVSVTIPSTVETIYGETYAFSTYYGSFYGCSSLVQVTLSEGLKTIGDNAFRGCSSLVSIVIPNSVTSIEYGAFANCSNLTKITLPESLLTMEEYVLSGCSSLREITLPNSVQVIGNYLFYECSSLENVTLSTGLLALPEYLFANCTSLEEVYIPENVLLLNQGVFYNCPNLVSVYIPLSILSIGKGAFTGCYSFANVYYEGTVEDWNKIDINYESKSGVWSNNDALADAAMHYSSTEIMMSGIYEAVQYVPFNAVLSGVSYTTALTSGRLPNGLGLFSDGTISGIPTEAGTFTFTLSNGEEYTLTVQAGTSATIEAQNDYNIIEYVPEITSNAVDQIYHIDGPYEEFLAFYINGNKMIEDVEFEAEEGSTVITIFAQTFAQQSEGTHTIAATFATSEDNTVAQVSQLVEKTVEAIPATFPYTDVSGSAWYYDYVYLMYRRGIIAGTSATTYSPSSNLTRGMMVDALYQLAGAPSATTSDFSDVSADAWYADAVSWAAEVGVTQGVGDNMFAPDTSITREQMATMIQRYCDLMGITLPLYTSAIPTDLSAISDWAVDSATAMYQYGVLNGDEAGNFNPSGTATRAEAASMFSNFLEILDRM